jgi:hypothetical protein
MVINLVKILLVIWNVKLFYNITYFIFLKYSKIYKSNIKLYISIQSNVIIKVKNYGLIKLIVIFIFLHYLYYLLTLKTHFQML